MRRTSIGFLLFISSVASSLGTPAVDWVATNGDAGFSGGSELTSSPVTTDADAETVVGSFQSVTLGVGASIQLTGSVTITGNTGNLPGNQFRWGLFDAPSAPATGAGSSYVGVWASAPAMGAAGSLVTADGSTANPFSGTASTTVVSASDPDGDGPLFDTSFSFELTITRMGATQISASATLSDEDSLLIEWPVTAAPASPESFTYDAVGILLGGTLNATSAAFSNMEVNEIAPLSDSDSDGMPDDYEDANGLDKNTDDAALDLDSDNVRNIDEYRGADGVVDTGDETSPNDPDSDDDLINDGTELANGTDPLSPDSDSDGLNDNVETNTRTFVDSTDTGTDPLDPDSDNDGTLDGVEVATGTDPIDPASNFGKRVFGIDFNRGDALGAPSQSLCRIISGSATQADNLATYSKTIGDLGVVVTDPGGSNLEFRGANSAPSRAIPGGDISRPFLVADFIGTRQGALTITLSELPAGTYLWKSYHLDTFTDATLGFAQGSSATTPNTIEARLGGTLRASVRPTALGSAGLGTTFISDGQVPTLAFAFTHDGIGNATVELSATESNSDDSFILLNGFEIFTTSP